MFFFVLVFIMTFTVNAQRHIKGVKGIDALAGATGKGVYGEAAYNYFLSNKVYLNFSGRFEYAKIQDVGLQSYSINPSVNYTIYSPAKWLFFSLKGGASGYWEQIDSDIPDNYEVKANSTSTFNYGVFAGVESELFFSNRVSWIINFRQNYNFARSGSKVFYGGTGLRFNIY